MSEAQVGPATRVAFHPIVIHREPGRAPLLGCPRSRRFLEVDESTLWAVRWLGEGRPVDEVRALLLEQQREEFDVEDLVALLRDRGFLRSIDGTDLDDDRRPSWVGRLLNRVPPGSVSWMRSPWLLVAAAVPTLAWLAAVATGVAEPPRAIHLAGLGFGRAASFLVILGGLVGFALLHELAHFLAARSHGVSASSRVSHRFYIVAFETDVTNAWVLPPRARLHVFLAGITLNVSFAASFSLLAAAVANGALPWGAEWIPRLRFLAYVNVFPLFFQLFLFARTDLYYVLQLALGERNLASDARRALRIAVKHVAALLLRRPAARCRTCDGPVFEAEPFCFRCGALFDIPDMARLAVTRERLLRLVPVGATFLVAQAAMLYFVFGIVYRLHLTAVGDVTREVLGAVRSEGGVAWALLADAAVVLLILVLQITMVGYFLATSLRGLGAKTWYERALARIRGYDVELVLVDRRPAGSDRPWSGTEVRPWNERRES